MPRRDRLNRIDQSRSLDRPSIGIGEITFFKGEEGDIAFRRTSGGLKMFIRANAKWHGVKVGESFDKIEKTIKDLEFKLSKIKPFNQQFINAGQKLLVGSTSLTSGGQNTFHAEDGTSESFLIKNNSTSNKAFELYNENNATNYFRIYEPIASGTTDYLEIKTEANGESQIKTVDGAAAAANLNIEADGHVKFVACGVGFARTTYADATNVTVDFRTGNKAHLDMTGGSISGTLTLQFPAVSGNFILVVQQDGSTRTIANYATKDAAGNAGNNDGGTSGAIRWQGGSAPDLTDGGNKRDILSFYWDAIEEVCYGVASLNF